MSAKMMGKVWDLILTPAKQIVLLALADHASHDGEDIKPGVPLIAWKTGYSERQVQRIMKELEEDGLLVKVRTRLGKPTIYRMDLNKGIAKEPYIPREERTTHAKVSRVKPHITPDNMTHVNMSLVTSHESGEAPRGDIASLDLTSIRHKDEPSIEIKREESNARDSTPVPFHIANPAGQIQKSHNQLKADEVKAHSVFQAFARGWDGIAPDVLPQTADTALVACQVIDRDISEGKYTLRDVEELTRSKLGVHRDQPYLLIYINHDMPIYLNNKRLESRPSSVRGAGLKPTPPVEVRKRPADMEGFSVQQMLAENKFDPGWLPPLVDDEENANAAKSAS